VSDRFDEMALDWWIKDDLDAETTIGELAALLRKVHDEAIEAAIGKTTCGSCCDKPREWIRALKAGGK
jgi:hypothetical protein